MGFRFRKSINLGGGFRVNLSKSGVGYSWGTKGFRVTKTSKGRSRVTTSIPGTGISYSTESSPKTSHKVVKSTTYSKSEFKQESTQYKMPLVPKLIIAVISFSIGIGYYLTHGYDIGTSIISGVLIGGVLYIILYGILGAILMSAEKSEKESGTALDKFIEKKESAERNTVQKSILSKDATRLQETFEIPGAYYHRTSIAKVANPNPDWKKTCKSLIKAGKANQKIYRFERTTKTAELVEEPNNPHDKNAVMVIVDGEKIGYIGADENLHVKSILKSKTVKSISATITGGEYKTIISESDMIKDKTGPYVTVKIQYQ